MAIRKIWIYPPLAIARVGGSPNPLEAFFWGPNDVRPEGTGQTTILPAETLSIQDDGTLRSYIPDRPIRFKDNDLFRPVCPFFELHGEWSENGAPVEGPITPEVLANHNSSISDLNWTVDVANRKAFHMSQDRGALVTASVNCGGDAVGLHELQGTSPSEAAEPLIPPGKSIRLGSVCIVKPSPEFPEIRLRFHPGKGAFYGPKNLQRRWDVRLPSENLILNTRSPWCHWRPTRDDPRGEPGGQYAQDENNISYGMIDDVCDGIVTCSISRLGLTAHARVVSGPPDYAPDRRTFVSFADGLKDRISRQEVADPQAAYFDNGVCDAEVLDLMERVFETVSLANADYLNEKAHSSNAEYESLMGPEADAGAQKGTFAIEPPIKHIPLPLTVRGRNFHRRLANVTVLKDIMRKRPDAFRKFVRNPFNTDPFYNRQMPFGMRGADGAPLSLTPRQYAMFEGWIARLHNSDVDPPSDKDSS